MELRGLVENGCTYQLVMFANRCNNAKNIHRFMPTNCTDCSLRSLRTLKPTWTNSPFPVPLSRLMFPFPFLTWHSFLPTPLSVSVIAINLSSSMAQQQRKYLISSQCIRSYMFLYCTRMDQVSHHTVFYHTVEYHT